MSLLGPWIFISISFVAGMQEPLILWNEHPDIADDRALCEEVADVYMRNNPTKFAYCERRNKAPPETCSKVFQASLRRTRCLSPVAGGS